MTAPMHRIAHEDESKWCRILYSLTDKTLTAAIIIIVSGDLLPRFDLYVAETNGVGRAGWTIDHVTSITYALNSAKIGRNL